MIRHYLLDTGIAQDFQDDRRGVRAKAKAVRALGHRVGICIPVLGELIRWFPRLANRCGRQPIRLESF